MSDKIREAFDDYQLGKMIDPATRYSSSTWETFSAGWAACEKKPSAARKESVWYMTPADLQEDVDA